MESLLNNMFLTQENISVDCYGIKKECFLFKLRCVCRSIKYICTYNIIHMNIDYEKLCL